MISIIRVCMLNFLVKLLEFSKSRFCFSITLLSFLKWLLKYICKQNKEKKQKQCWVKFERSFAENKGIFFILVLLVAFKIHACICIQFFVNITDKIIGSGERERFYVRNFVQSSSVCEFHEKLKTNTSTILKAWNT